MTEPVFRQGQWYQQRPDGTWLKWDPATSQWNEQTGPPPPPSPTDPHPRPSPADYEIEPYKSLRPLAHALVAMFAVGLGLHLIAIWSGSVELSLLERAADGGMVTEDEATTSDMRQAAIAIAQLVLLVALIVVFLIWFRRAYRNLPSLGARNLRFRPGWAVGAWFVPILNWFRPMQIARDIWRASDPTLPDTAGTPWQGRTTSWLLGFWWAAWLVSNQVDQVSFRTSFRAETLPQLQTSAKWTLAADAVSAVATVLVIAVVWRVTARQEERARRLTTSGAHVPGLTA